MDRSLLPSPIVDLRSIIVLTARYTQLPIDVGATAIASES
jgi:hypothetical protein